MFKNRAVKLSFVKDPKNENEFQMPAIDPKEIEEIARRSVLDVTKLAVASIGALMTLHTALKITESHLSK